MAFHALADYQNHVIGWLQWEQSSLGDGAVVRHERCVWMARETTKWPSTRWPITKIMSSDGCNGNRVPLEMGPWYDFREFGCHLGNVG